MGRRFLARLEPAAADMGCFCAVPEEFYCEVLLLDESKLTLTTQQQGIKVGTGRGRARGGWQRGGLGGPRLGEGCRGSRQEGASAAPRAQVEEGGRASVGEVGVPS